MFTFKKLIKNQQKILPISTNDLSLKTRLPPYTTHMNIAILTPCVIAMEIAKMRNNILALVALLGLAACAPSGNDSTGKEAEETSTDEIVDTKDTDFPGVVEYVWTKKGPDFTEEKLDELLVKWNGLIDEGGYPMRGAQIITPEVEDERYDLMWVLMWSSMEERNASWTDWALNYDAEWNSMTAGITSYSPENVFPFKPMMRWYGSAEKDANTDTGTSEVEYSFCSYNEDFGEQDLANFETAFIAFLEAYEEENGPISFAYLLNEPYTDAMPVTYPIDDIDYMWVSVWPNLEEKRAGFSAYMDTDLPQIADTFSTCKREAFSSRRIR